MPSREEMIAALQSQDQAAKPVAVMPNREQMIAELQKQDQGGDRNVAQKFLSQHPSIKSSVETGLGLLPSVGMVGGGVGGAALAGPVGGVGGAGLGAATGQTLENVGRDYLIGDNTPRKSPTEALNEGSAAELTGLGAGKAIGKLADTPVAQKMGSYVAEKAAPIVDSLKTGASKIGEMFTGVPEEEIRTYAKHADQIKQMAKASDNSTAEAADNLRRQWSKDIQGFKSEMNNQISSSLGDSNKTIDADPILKALENKKSQINSKLNPEQIEQIDGLKQKVSSLTGEDNQIPIKDAHDLKGFLQDAADSVYKPQGTITNYGKKSAFAAKDAARTTRGLINESEPSVAEANNKLAQLHEIENGMNRNITKVGKPEASIVAAGSGGNARNAEALESLDDLTGSTTSEDAKKLAAMRTFGSPKLSPVDVTGKANYRAGAGAALGGLAGHYTGLGAIPGAFVGGAAASPAALRTLIDSGQLSKEAISQLLANPTTRGLLINKSSKGLMDNK